MFEFCFRTNRSNYFGITTIDTNDEDYVIWDSYTITFTVDDHRVNIHVNITMSYTVISDYDAIAYDGTVNLNYTTYNQTTAQRQGYTVSSLSGDDTYGITAISTNDDDYAIWDSLTITGPTDNRIDLNENASGIVVSAVRDYDSSAFDGTFTMNNTDYNGDGSVVRWGYTVSSATGGTYGITTISSNDETYCIWDRVGITLSTNMTWTVIGYYINVSYVATYEYDSTSHSGTITWNDNVGVLTKNTVANYTWYPTSITDDTYGLTGFSNNTVYCIFDDIEITSVNANWVQEDDYLAFYRMEMTTFYWAYNDSAVENTPQIKIQSQMNGTNDEWGLIKDTGSLSMILLVGSFDYDWYWANITLYAQFSSYNWSIHSVVSEVDILHSIHFSVFSIDETDDYVIFEYYVEHDNASWVSVWDNRTGTPVLIYNHTDEGSHRFLLSETVGTHPLLFLINQSVSLSWAGQTCDPSLTDDWWAWNDYTYIVTVADFDVDIEAWSAEDVVIEITGISNLDMNWYVYNEGVYSGETGSETEDIGFTFDFAKNTGIGKHNFSIYFNDTVDGSQYRWFNRSYRISAVYDWCYIELYGPDGLGLDATLFKIHVNGTRLYSGYPQFYNRTDCVYNITITNYFDEIVLENNYTMPVGRIVDVSISVYTFKVYNQMDNEFIYFNMTSSGGATWSEHIGPREIVKFYLYSGNTYTYTFTALEGQSGGTHTGLVTLSYDTGMIIDGYDLVEIYESISRIGGGGGMTLETLEKGITASMGGILNQVQWYSWLSVLLIFVGLYAIPFVKNKGRIRNVPAVPSEVYVPYLEEKPKPKSNRGKHLKPHHMKKGHDPRRGVRKSEKTELEKMSDDIWGKLPKAKLREWEE